MIWDSVFEIIAIGILDACAAAGAGAPQSSQVFVFRGRTKFVIFGEILIRSEKTEVYI